MRVPLTLVFVREGRRILLGMKKRGFGVGRWNGFGGKLVGGESIIEGAKRELYEESGLRALTLTKRGLLSFSWQGKESVLDVSVFEVDAWEGDLCEGEEMRPKWFLLDEIPFASMWSDDIYWFPYLLKRIPFVGTFLFDHEDKVLQYSVTAQKKEQK